MVRDGVEVSIVVPCYQAETTLGKCLASLIGQEADFPYEVLVVENGSRDRTLEVARELAATERGQSLRVLVEERPGAYAARNRGLREARGDLVLFTDSDCVAEPGWAGAMVEELGKPGVLMVGGEVTADPTQSRIVARYGRAATILSQAHTLRHPRGPFLQTANLGVRREDAESVDGFDEELYSGGDADFCWRLRAARPDGAVRLLPGAEVHHHHRETLGGLYRQYRRYGQSDVLLAKKHGTSLPHTLAKVGLDLIRVTLSPVLAVLISPVALLKRDLLPAMVPLLRAVRIVGRRSGQIQALAFPDRLHRA